DSLMTQLEAFSDEFARLARTKEQTALAKGFGEFVGEAHTSIAYIAEASRQHGSPAVGQPLPSSGDLADDHGDMPTPEEWQWLQAEWTHDSGLRRLEDR